MNSSQCKSNCRLNHCLIPAKMEWQASDVNPPPKKQGHFLCIPRITSAQSRLCFLIGSRLPPNSLCQSCIFEDKSAELLSESLFMTGDEWIMKETVYEGAAAGAGNTSMSSSSYHPSFFLASTQAGQHISYATLCGWQKQQLSRLSARGRKSTRTCGIFPADVDGLV